MQFILAPSKTMDMNPVDLLGLTSSTPKFQKDAERIAKVIQITENLSQLMKISSQLAESTRKKYMSWGEETKPAIFSYVGDVYKGFYATTLNQKDLIWAQQHLWIMSGLYGMLRPLDLISPYRLEMKAALQINDKKDIYEYWGRRLAETVDAEASDGIICVLSSDEYARPVTRFSKSTIITPIFYDNKSDKTIGTVPIYSKMMRGVMARWVIDNRVESAEKLKDFSAQGYSYNAQLSTEYTPAFFRESPKPISYKK